MLIASDDDQGTMFQTRDHLSNIGEYRFHIQLVRVRTGADSPGEDLRSDHRRAVAFLVLVLLDASLCPGMFRERESSPM